MRAAPKARITKARVMTERIISIMAGAGLVVALGSGRRDADTRQGGVRTCHSFAI